MKYYLALFRTNIFYYCLVLITVGFGQTNSEIKLAENLLRARNYEGALQLYKNNYEKGNLSHTVLNGINSCLTELGRSRDLIIFLKDVTSKIPDIYSYSIDLGRAFYLNDQLDSALYIWDKVYSVEPPQLMRYRMVAQAMTSLRLFDEAIDVYSRAIKLIPDQQAIHLDIATLYKAQLNYEKASEHYLIYYQNFKKQQSYVRSLLINMAKDEEATDRIIITILNFNDNNDPDLNELLANLYMRKKEYEKAFEIILEIEKNLPKNNLMYLSRFAAEAAKDKSYEYVIKAYEYALSKVDDKLSDAIKLNLARAYYSSAIELTEQGETKESDTRIQKSLEILKQIQTAFSVEKYNAYELSADIYKDQYSDLDLALENYNQINLQRIGAVNADQVRLKIAETYLLKNNLVQAEKYYKDISSRQYTSLAHYNLAELYFFTARFTKSKKLYNTIISQVGMKDSLANNALSRDFQIDQFLSDSVNFAKYSQASLLTRQKKYSEAAKKFRELYFNNNITSFDAGMKAVILYNKINKIDESNEILQDIIKSYADEDKTDFAYFLLANNYKKQNDLENALITYQEILVRFPTSFYFEQARVAARDINTILQERTNN